MYISFLPFEAVLSTVALPTALNFAKEVSRYLYMKNGQN